MDMRYISSAGYQLWETGTTTVSGIETIVIGVPVCDPNLITDEVGKTNLYIDEFTIGISTDYMVPHLKAFPSPNNT